MITLVLGGVRSGKSEVAERLAGPGAVTYLATARPDGEAGFTERIARHRARRPPQWSTVEVPMALPSALRQLTGPVLVDALGTWVANHMIADEKTDLRPDVDGLVAALRGRAGDTILVSEEVGLGVHPPTALGRRFADLLGETNRRVAEVADRCLLVVAGRVVELPAGAPPEGEPAAFVPADDGDPRILGDVAPLPRGLQAAISFLTPLGGPAAPTPAAFTWFPLVGAVIGLILGGWWSLADNWFGPVAAAAAVVAADLAITGALHFDGLVDSADGLLPHLPRERRLAVMAEPTAGAFGIAAGAGALVLRTAALISFGDPQPFLLAGLWCASRTVMALGALSGTYARAGSGGGLASAFLPPDRKSPFLSTAFIVGLAMAAPLAGVDDAFFVLAVLAATGAGLGFHVLAGRRLGGFTGDTLGAAGVVAETLGLFVALAVL